MTRAGVGSGGAGPGLGALTVEDAKRLLQYFTPAEVAEILNRSHTTPPPPPPPSAERLFVPLPIDVATWAETRFYVPDRIDPISLSPTSDIGPIVFMEWQKVVLRYLFDVNRPYDKWFQNIIISTLKKTGKTIWAALLGRWIAETWGLYSEVICLGSDREQAEDKLYSAITRSIELSPLYDPNLQVLFDAMAHPDDPTLLIPDYSRPLWRIRSDGAQFIPNHGSVKAVPRVYKKLAGGNQTAAIFTEMWAVAAQSKDNAQRLWDEMTPPPTRPRAVRIAEGYAGYEGESGLWEELWDQAMDPKKGARMVTRAELLPFGGWPFPPAPGSFKDNPFQIHRDSEDPIPLYINPSLSIGAFIDQGEAARRMPWQTPAYYESQRLDESYDRHHRNVPSAHKDEFIPRGWINATHIRNHPGYINRRDQRTGRQLPPIPEHLRTMPPLEPDEAIVLSFDGSVSDDTTVLVVLSYATWWHYEDEEISSNADPATLKRSRATNDEHAMIRAVHVWEPSKAHPMNYTTMVKPEMLRYYGYILDPKLDEDSDSYVFVGPDYNVLELVYDAYQANDLLLNLRNDYGCWIRSFSQSVGRDKSDHDLYTAFRDKQIWHDGDEKLVDHLMGCAKRVPKVQGSSMENRIHIVKRSNQVKIDVAVAASQGLFELRRLGG